MSFAIVVLALTGCGDNARSSNSDAAAPGSAPDTARLRVPSEGMSPTLELGQIVTADLAAYRPRDPAIGDIVVFNPPAGAQDERCGTTVPSGAPCNRSAGGRDTSVKFIKRVVAGPGDRIKLVHGRVVLNGKRPPEPFAKRCGRIGECDFPMAIKIPRDQYFMLGDNRANSSDSRFWGPVPKRWILGRIQP